MKSIILIMLAGIVLSLGSAMFSMTRGPAGSKAMANALTVRITLSIALVALLVLAWVFGWVDTGEV